MIRGNLRDKLLTMMLFTPSDIPSNIPIEKIMLPLSSGIVLYGD